MPGYHRMPQDESADFPPMPLAVTGATLSGLSRTVRDSNFPPAAGLRRHEVALHRGGGPRETRGPVGARYYLSPEEGEGFWDVLEIRDGLHLSIGDARYHEPVKTFWPTDPVCKIRISLSGRMRMPSGKIIIQAGDCQIHCLSGRRRRNYLLDGVEEPYRVITVHVEYKALADMGLAPENLGPPFDHILQSGKIPDFLAPIPAAVSLQQMATDMLQSRDLFMADTRRFYLAARSEEILVNAIEKTRPRRVVDIGANRVSSRDLSRLNEAHRILEASFAKPPTVAELARMVGINTTKLKLGFRELFGETTQAHINRLRMEHALSLVENSDLTFAEIAYQVGYSHPANFTRAFRKHFGMTPGKVRKG